LSFAIEDSQIGITSALAAGLTVIELAAASAIGRDPDSALVSSLRVQSLTDGRVRSLILGHRARPSRSSITP
jgi:beta-phosphoglucomutase-like phosphatase (HAD superfamily)